jgi:hypothetical protein
MHQIKGINSLVRLLESKVHNRNICFGFYDYSGFSFVVPDISTVWVRILLSLGQYVYIIIRLSYSTTVDGNACCLKQYL